MHGLEAIIYTVIIIGLALYAGYKIGKDNK